MAGISVYDSRIFRNTFSTPELRAIFSDEAYTHRLIEVEAALARAEARVGIIPRASGHQISSHLIGPSSKLTIDHNRLGLDTDNVGYPILPLLNQITSQVPSPHGSYIHWGATTHDIMDNATTLQLRSALSVVRRDLLRLVTSLTSLARRYRNTPMPGRTHLQHALPITFGYKVSVWLFPLLTHLDRLSQLQSSNLLVQFGGAAGTLASLSTHPNTGKLDPSIGLRVRHALAKELDLLCPPVTWHVSRDNYAEILNFLALLAGSLGKIALDISLMSTNELSEVGEPIAAHRGASSTMPQKRNPIYCEAVLAAAKLLREKAGIGLDAMLADFERQTGAWHLEWSAVPEACCLAGSSLMKMGDVIQGLVVSEENMARNLRSGRGLICAEAVMMGLARKAEGNARESASGGDKDSNSNDNRDRKVRGTGGAASITRQEAHDLVYDACGIAQREDRTLFDVLTKDDRVMVLVSVEELRDLCDPLKYLGACGLQVDEVCGIADGYLVEKSTPERATGEVKEAIST